MKKSIWHPSDTCIQNANVTRFIQVINEKYQLNLKDYWQLRQWSIENIDQFWHSIWLFSGLQAQTLGETVFEKGDTLYESSFFPDAKINFAENYLNRQDDAVALTFWGEDKVKLSYTFKELYKTVAQMSEALKEAGVKKGDVVAAYLPNMPQTIITMLATTSLGGVFTSASPDFGIQGILDRFGQVKPKILVTCDGYFYNGKVYDIAAKVAQIAQEINSIKLTVIVQYIGLVTEKKQKSTIKIRKSIDFEDFIAPFRQEEISKIAFEYVEFNHPVYILYSSGTTGKPKCIIHRAGGVLLKHACELIIHADIKKDDCLFYFTTCGWMMWNWSSSALLCGASLALYDGSPFLKGGQIQFDYLDTCHVTHFGTSPKFLQAAEKAGVFPQKTHALTTLRVIITAGSPLLDEHFNYVYKKIKKEVHLNSISGGTDLVGIFMGGMITLPLYSGEMQVAALGMDIDVFDEKGQKMTNNMKGELVCKQAFPTIPLGFLNDSENKRFKSTYFNQYEGVWYHGDYTMKTRHDGWVILGRSDTTLNPGGIRIGTAEIYREIDKVTSVLESCVIGQQWPPELRDDIRIVLFVRLREGCVLDETLEEEIKVTIAKNTTRRHVPAKIIQVQQIPRTKSGKVVEVAIRKIIHGEVVDNKTALDNPEALCEYEEMQNQIWIN